MCLLSVSVYSSEYSNAFNVVLPYLTIMHPKNQTSFVIFPCFTTLVSSLNFSIKNSFNGRFFKNSNY